MLFSTLLAAAATASPVLSASVGARSIAGIPYSSNTLDIVGVTRRSARKAAQLERHLDLIRGTASRWDGDGAQYEFFGPGAGVEYAVNVTVAGQNVSVIFDTGSSDLWFPATNFTCLFVNGTETDQSECNFGPTYFNVTSAADNGFIVPVDFVNNFNISYGDGEFATGSAYIGPVGFAGITVNNTEFSVVESSYWAGDGVTDGLIGFANPLLTSVYAGSDPTVDNSTIARVYQPWFYQATDDGLVAPFFSIALNRVSIQQEVEDNGYAVLEGLGTVTLGGMPSQEAVPLTGKSITTPNILFNTSVDGKNVSVPAYYTVPVDSWNFKGAKHLKTDSSPLTILDSGTTLIYAPNEVADKFNSEIVPKPGAFNETIGAYLVMCNATIPDLSITIAGEEFKFTREDLVYGFDETNTMCLSSVTRGGNATDDVYILGDRFLVNVVASFNIESNEISIFEREPY